MFSNVSQTTRANTNMTIYAVQVGGDSAKLPNVFSKWLYLVILPNEKKVVQIYLRQLMITLR